MKFCVIPFNFTLLLYVLQFISVNLPPNKELFRQELVSEKHTNLFLIIESFFI